MSRKRDCSGKMKTRTGAKMYEYLNTFTVKLDSLVETDHRETVLNPKYVKPMCGFDEERPFYNRPSLSTTKCTNMQLLHKKLLNHKWGDVVVLLLGLMKINWKEHLFTPEKKMEELVWRVGMETLLQHPFCVDNHQDNLLTFKRVLGYYNTRISQLHILLEHCFTLLCQHQFADAKKNLEKYDYLDRSLMGSSKPHRAKEIVHWMPIMEGYLGLIDYVLWKQSVSQASADQLSLSEDVDRRHAQLATDALKHLKKVVERPGTWDIFVSKQVEMLVYYSMWDEAREILCSYSASHVENPNAHKYLIQYLTDHSDENGDVEHIKVSALQNLFKIAPSDALCLHLHDFYLKQWLETKPKRIPKTLNPTSNLYLALDVLFTILSYVACHNDPRPWERLQSLVGHLSCLKSNSHRKVIQKFLVMTERDQWWPKLFHRHYVCNAEVIALKDDIARSCPFLGM